MILHNERQQMYSSVAQIIVNRDYFNGYSISGVKVSQSIVQC